MATYAQLEDRLTQLGKEIDNHLEDTYGDLYPLHPNRPRRGSAANPSYDGLFATTVCFTTGYGSEAGRGYVVNVDIRTLSLVTPEDRAKVNKETYCFLQKLLPERFPERKLMVIEDGKVLKIVGDFSIQ